MRLKILFAIIIILLLLLLCLGYYFRKDIFIYSINTLWKFYPECNRPLFTELSSDFENIEETNILMSYPDNLVVENGKQGEWDESIREIGNIVYSSELEKYFLYYSGHKGENENSNVYVGMACSEDGIKWEKFGKVLETPSEDPYVVIHNSKFYLFYEDKSEIPFRKIDLAVSEDGKSFEIIKKGVIVPKGDSWQKDDVSSPVIVKDKNNWVMLYEGRGGKNRGTIGYAVSQNLIDWISKDKPVFKGQYKKPWDMFLFWDNYLVPDDIVYIDDKYLLTYHGLGLRHIWQTGLAVSNDLMNWNKANDFPIHPASTVMFANVDSQILFYLATDQGIKFYKPLKGKL